MTEEIAEHKHGGAELASSEARYRALVREVAEQDVVIEGGKVTAYRTKLKVSFKYHGGE